MRLWYYTEQQEKHIQDSISVSEITIEYLHKIIIIAMLCQYVNMGFLYIHVSKNVIVSKDTIFHLLWYNVDVLKQSYIHKIFFSLIPQFFIFSE